MVRMVLAAAVAAGGLGLGAQMAHAQSVPFYGYSDYFGGPAIGYSYDDDVQQTTRPVDGDLRFGMRTYHRGGPFWHYQSARPSRAYRAHSRHGRRARVLHRKG